MRLSRSLGSAAVVALLAVTACGSPAKPATTNAGGGTPAASAPSTTPPGTSKSGPPATPGAAGSASATTPPKNGSAPSGAPASGAASNPAAPTPSYASAADLPIDAKVTPGCVTPGTAARLEVRTKAAATVGYLAIYAGDKSGAAPPWGEGYGGNHYGATNSEGEWADTWVVAVNAPAGKARATVVVAWKGKQRQIEVPFSVGGREAGGCGA